MVHLPHIEKPDYKDDKERAVDERENLSEEDTIDLLLKPYRQLLAAPRHHGRSNQDWDQQDLDQNDQPQTAQVDQEILAFVAQLRKIFQANQLIVILWPRPEPKINKLIQLKGIESDHFSDCSEKYLSISGHNHVKKSQVDDHLDIFDR